MTFAADEPAAAVPPPRYRRYRAGRGASLRPRTPRERQLAGLLDGGGAPGAPGGRAWLPRSGRTDGWREYVRPRRVALAVLLAAVIWIAVSVVLFLASATFEQSSPTGPIAGALDSAGFPLTSANNILVLGSDQRPPGSHEPGASTSGPSRSDVIMLIRTGAGHSARLSIPRDTIVDIPGHGPQKINAAYAFGGPALAIRTVKALLGVPINHLVEVNFANFPALINAMGGVTYTGSCVYARVDGGYSQGGVTLRLKQGTHHLNGKQALALARVRHNSCNPAESDLTRAKRQQKIFSDMKSQLLSVGSFFRLPWVSWSAPEAIRSDMSGPTLLALFGALAVGGTPPTRLLSPSGQAAVPGGGIGLTVSDAERRAAAAQFMKG